MDWGISTLVEKESPFLWAKSSYEGKVIYYGVCHLWRACYWSGYWLSFY